MYIYIYIYLLGFRWDKYSYPGFEMGMRFGSK